MAANSSDTARTKHIDTSYQFVRLQETREVVKLLYVHTDDNPAGIMTKALGVDCRTSSTRSRP